MAVADLDDRALAEIHYLRGNLHFARGELSACRGEHERALEAARRIDSPEWQARALSGLADAQYMDCRMATALRHFADCVDLCDAHGFAAHRRAQQRDDGALPNLYLRDFDQGLDDMRKGLEIAVRIGNRHAQMFATQSLGLCLTAAGRYAEADEFQAEALEQARALNARRYEAVILAQCAEVALSQGRRGEALALARAGREIADETGPGFRGSDPPGSARLDGGRSRRTERLRWPPERRCSRKAPSATTTSGFDATRSRARCFGRIGTRPKDKPTRCSCAWRTNRWPTPHAWRRAAHGLARRGRGDATDADEKKLEHALTLAAEADMRVDALGIALRSM